MPAPAQDPRTSAYPGPDFTTITKDPHQLGLGLLTRIGQWEKPPPERALFRELLDIAVPADKNAVIVIGTKTIRAPVVHHVGWVLYGRANAAGIIPDFSVERLATDARLGKRTVMLSLQLYREWGMIRSSRPNGRRRPAEHRLNVGGLDWPAVRKRAALEAAERGQQRLDFDRESTEPKTLKMPEWCPGDTTRSPEWCPGDTTKGLRTEGLRTDPPIVAATTQRARGADGRQQQQQPTPDRKILDRRAEGLMSVIAIRSRKLGQTFDEAKERRRLEAGETTVDALQRQADELAATIENPPPLTDGPDLATQIARRNGGRQPTGPEVETIRAMMRRNGWLPTSADGADDDE